MNAGRTEAAISEGRAPYVEGAFAVTVDPREQRPWRLPLSIPIVVRAMVAGDYAPVGLETRCAVERKSLDDLVNSIFFSPGRFRRELEKLKKYEWRRIIVEASYEDILARKYFASGRKFRPAIFGGGVTKRPGIEPMQVLEKIETITDTLVPIVMAGSRKAAATIALRRLRQFWEEKRLTR
ncbi:MAG: ERCC4 domain-containing protein [Polyangiaceae bacterium]